MSDLAVQNLRFAMALTEQAEQVSGFLRYSMMNAAIMQSSSAIRSYLNLPMGAGSLRMALDGFSGYQDAELEQLLSKPDSWLCCIVSAEASLGVLLSDWNKRHQSDLSRPSDIELIASSADLHVAYPEIHWSQLVPHVFFKYLQFAFDFIQTQTEYKSEY